MRQLTRSVLVKAPSTFALAHMNTYFLERGPDSSGAQLALRFPLPDILIGGLTLEKRVTVRFKPNRGGSGSQPLAIGWLPLGSGPLPSFDGTLAATAETATTCRLTLSGSYAPPGGVAGVVFDSLVGVRIARATVVALLERFGQSIESDYAIRMGL